MNPIPAIHTPIPMKVHPGCCINRYCFLASITLTSVPFGTTCVTSKLALLNNVWYSSSVLSFPPGISSITKSSHLLPNGSLPVGFNDQQFAIR